MKGISSATPLCLAILYPHLVLAPGNPCRRVQCQGLSFAPDLIPGLSMMDRPPKKEKLLEKIKELLTTDLNLDFLLRWEDKELESLFVSLKDRLSNRKARRP
ncbi:MAG: hypothetical protein AMK69_00690 [Nitrospira bacterium SG8_3]|nr:MAG: hypothetical protein AMK69_00690 [Nitrospira bacterium SG8_3]